MNANRQDYIITISNHATKKIKTYRFYGSETELKEKLDFLTWEDFEDESWYNYKNDYKEGNGFVIEIGYGEFGCNSNMVYKAIPFNEIHMLAE